MPFALNVIYIINKTVLYVNDKKSILLTKLQTASFLPKILDFKKTDKPPKKSIKGGTSQKVKELILTKERLIKKRFILKNFVKKESSAAIKLKGNPVL